MDDEGNTLKAGDVCLDCQQLGVEKHLRYFKINLNGDTLLKCESNMCMYPYEMSSTDDEDNANNDEDKKGICETNSMQFIDDLLQQIKNEAAERNDNYNDPVNSLKESVNNTEYFDVNSKEMPVEFELSFLDKMEEFVSENLMEVKTAEFFDNKNNLDLSEQTIPETATIMNNIVIEPLVIESVNNDGTLVTNNPTLSLPSSVNTETQQQVDKPKINIQAVETININPFSNNLLTTAMFNISTDVELKTPPTFNTELSLSNATHDSTCSTSTNPPKASNELKNSKLSNSTKATGIPKANIMSGSHFLQKLAQIEEKTPKYSIKCKNTRNKPTTKKEKIRKKASIKADDTPDLVIDKNSESNLKEFVNKTVLEEKKPFSLEVVSELLNAKRIKNFT